MAAVTLKPTEELLVLPDVAGAARAAAERVSEILARRVPSFGATNSAGPDAGGAEPVARDGAKRAMSVALAGGKTPAAMYRLLTQPPLREQVDWSAIEWFWGDERCVRPDHVDSNYRMAMETLLGPLGIAGDRIHRMPADATDLDPAAREHEKTIRERVPVGADGVPELDLILLGIGSDGHTASLFPGSEGLQERERLVVAHYAPAPKAMRMTMTYPLLWAARHVVFLACGADKAEAIQRIFEALSSQQSAVGSEDPPAAAVRTARGHVTWILDASAVRLLVNDLPSSVRPS